MFPVTSDRFIFFCKFPSHLVFLLHFIPMYVALNSFVILLFFPLKMASAVTVNAWEKHGSYLNSFYPEIRGPIQRLKRVNDWIFRNKVSVLSNHTHTHKHTHTHTHTHTHIYIYIYVYMKQSFAFFKLSPCLAKLVLKSYIFL